MKSKAPYALCDKCPFKDRAVAHSTGPQGAKVVVVSRSPGYHESMQGKSFSGPSGRVLNHLLELQGVDRKEVRATNVVLCQSDGDEDGFGLATACCAPRLEAETLTADTIIACGREAAQAFVGSPNIYQNRGYVHKREAGANNQRIIVTNNPAVVLRDDGAFPELVRDFRLAINPLPEPKLPKVSWTEDIDEATEWVEQILASIKSGGTIASDIETFAPDYRRLAAVGFAVRPEKAVVFGQRVVGDTNFYPQLQRLYSQDCRYLWHNGKYDVKVLRGLGINARVDEDSMLLSWCLDERPGDPESGAGGHSLEWLLKDTLGWPLYEPSSVREFKKTGVLASSVELYKYNGMDTAGTIGLYEVLRREAIADNVYERPYKSLLIRLSEVLTRMESQGVAFDTDRAMDILETEVWPRLRELRQGARKTAQIATLNLNSPKQLVQLLYEEWGIKHDLTRPKIERKGKQSTDQYVRKEIIEGRYTCNVEAVHPTTVKRFTKFLDDYKTLDTQRGTFFEGLVLRARNGRLYTDFKIHGTESGRLSSSKPNLQNVTRPKEGIPSVRSCFLPDPGHVLISADLSQAELRTIAVLSADEHLQSIYLDSTRSLHKEVATEFYGENYTYEQYVKAKNINFGVAYWQSAFSFSQLYGMPYAEADKFIKWWWERFPQVWEWTLGIEKEVMEVGEIQSPFGHKRRFYVIPSDESGRLHLVKEGINFLPQNIAANITLWGLCDFSSKVDWRIAQPRLTVHDSILVNCKESEVDTVAALLKECLENAPKRSIEWDFPYLAEITIGRQHWGSLEEYELIAA